MGTVGRVSDSAASLGPHLGAMSSFLCPPHLAMSYIQRPVSASLVCHEGPVVRAPAVWLSAALIFLSLAALGLGFGTGDLVP